MTDKNNMTPDGNYVLDPSKPPTPEQELIKGLLNTCCADCNISEDACPGINAPICDWAKSHTNKNKALFNQHLKAKGAMKEKWFGAEGGMKTLCYEPLRLEVKE